MPLPGTAAPKAPVVPVEPIKPAAPAVDPMVALLAKERAHAAERQKFAGEREGWAKEKAELEALRAWKTGLVRNPSLLEEPLGKDWYEKLTEYRLNDNKITPELIGQTLDAKLSEWDKKQQDRAESERKRIADEQTAIVEQFRNDTSEWVKAQPDYELIHLHGVHGEVTRLIENHFKQTQKILSAKEAADLVEADLAERVEKSLKTKRFSKQAPPEKRIESAQPRTLTSALTAVSTPPSAELDMSDDARLTRAIARGRAIQLSRQGQ